MSIDTAHNVIAVLTKNFKKEFPQAGLAAIWPTMVKESPGAIEAAADYMLLNKTHLPSPADLLSRVQYEGKQIAKRQGEQRELEWAKTKGGATRDELEKQGSIFSREQADAYGKHAMQALNLLASGASHQDKLECFKAMDQSYPGLLWLHMGMSAQKDIERCGRIKSVPPAYDGR